MEQQPMMLVPMPMMYHWQPPPSSLPQEAPPEVTTGPLKIPQEECEARVVNHAEEELYYQLAEASKRVAMHRRKALGEMYSIADDGILLRREGRRLRLVGRRIRRF